MKDKGVVVLGVVKPDQGPAADPGWVKTKAVIAEYKINYPTLIDPEGKLSDTFGINGIPYTVVIGPDGLIKADFAGAQGEAALRAALKQAGVE